MMFFPRRSFSFLLSGYLVVIIICASIISMTAAQDDGTTASSPEAICEAETVVLNTNSELSAATTELLTTTKDAILADFTSFCRVIGLQCTVNIADYSKFLRELCVAQNGQLVETTYTLTCETDTVSPIEIPGTVNLQNIPACLGASCQADALPPSIVQVQDDVVVQINTEVDAALGDRINCQVGSSSDNDGSGALSHHSFSSFTTTTIIIISLLAVVFTRA